MTHKKPTLHGVPQSFRPLVSLWVLRLLLNLSGYRLILDDRAMTGPWALGMLGLEDFFDPGVTQKKSLLERLRDMERKLKILAPSPPSSTTLAKNLAWLTKTLGMSKIESDIVMFLAVVHHTPGLDRLLEKFGTLRTGEIHFMLSEILGYPQAEITKVLRHTSPLIRSGLVWADMRDRWTWSLKICLLEGIGDLLALEHEDQNAMFASNYSRSPVATLNLEDFPHLDADLKVLEPYLREALRNRQRGVNILIYGPPGTGKTELARAMAKHLGVPLFEVAVEDRNGQVIKGEARFGAFQLAQGVLGGDPRPLILFDEIEDVFRTTDADGLGSSRVNQSGRKGFINKLLLQGTVPTIWITNAPNAIDRAYLRRFDFVLEMGIPPRRVRSQVIARYTKGLPLKATWRSQVAEHEHLTPAAIERASKVTRVVLSAEPVLAAEKVLGRILDNSLEVICAPGLPKVTHQDHPPYRADLLNADRDLDAICAGLKQTGSGRVCLFGPPGTGKTAWGRHLAEMLDRPLHVHRASDLLGPYVGETEARMAKMFRQAQDAGALLLLDEADTFFRDRTTTDMKGWEVSQVNEMLVQTESFNGVFVASTNLLDRIDAATLRRFDLKIHFDFLAPEQTVAMLADYLGVLDVHLDNKAEMDIQGISNLTPGDFANVMRQSRLEPVTTASEFVARLARECSLKGGPPRRIIGFRGDHVAA